jgi:phosphoadenosine phosphosulfate reductase
MTTLAASMTAPLRFVPRVAARGGARAIPAAAELDGALRDKASLLAERLAEFARRHPGARLASSLGPEDQLIASLIARDRLQLSVFTLDTGRLHAQTLDLVERLYSRYGLVVEIFRPDPVAVNGYVSKNGANAFYESVQLRRDCCGIRKVEPLGRALAGAPAWISGQRREQSPERSDLPFEETDARTGLPKLNPLADWSEGEVWALLIAWGVPVNPLHALGYASVGCEPCTRAVREDEDPRAGRWWWESGATRECGLHLHASASEEPQAGASAVDFGAQSAFASAALDNAPVSPIFFSAPPNAAAV